MKKAGFIILLVGICIVSSQGQSRVLTLGESISSPPSSLVENGSFTEVSAKVEGTKAQAFVDKMGQRAIAFLSNDSLSQNQKENEFRQLLRDNFDIATIGRFALGPKWKTATAKQKEEYQKLFEDMIVEVYSTRFSDYQGHDFDVTSYQPVGSNDVAVQSYIVPNTASKVRVDWRVRNRNGNYKIVDVVIEGISMSQTQRSEFASVIARGGGDVDVLLAHLRK